MDIGTYGTWVIESCEAMYFHEDECIKGGTYNRTQSDSSSYISSDYYGDDWFDLQDGDSHRFSYYADDFTIGDGARLENVTFGLDDFPTSMQFGTLGLGFGKGVNTNASSMMDNLAAQGVIDTKAFAISLGRNTTDDGALILGGVDTKKFAGPLHRIPIADPPTYPFDYDEYRYWLQLDNATLTDGEGNATTVPGFAFMPQTIDHISYLPGPVVASIAAAFGVYNTSMDVTDWYIVDCRWRDAVNGSLALNFPTLTVEIPYREFIIQNDIRDGMEDECYITAIPRSEEDEQGLWYLGHPFLRAVHAVFDQDDKAVWLAEYQDCGSEVVAFAKGEDVEGKCEGRGSGGNGSGSDGDGGDEGGSGSGDQDDDSAGAALGWSGVLLGTAAAIHVIFG